MLRASIGNGIVKELICMTHRHEKGEGIIRGSGGCCVEGGKEGKIGTTVKA